MDMELHGAGAEDGGVEEEPGRHGRHVRELEEAAATGGGDARWLRRLVLGKNSRPSMESGALLFVPGTETERELRERRRRKREGGRGAEEVGPGRGGLRRSRPATR